MLYTNARAGVATDDPGLVGSDLRPLFDAIVALALLRAAIQIAAADAGRESRRERLPGPNCDRAIFNGAVHLNDPVAVLKTDGSVQETRVTKLFMFDGLKRVEIEEAAAGDIVCLAGIENITIGETITSPDHRVPSPESRSTSQPCR